MDSIRRPVHKAEAKPVTERRRRKSDLVIMWQSIWGVTVTIFLEIWLILLGLWEALKFYFNSDVQQEVRKWLVEYLPRVPDDFAESWRDGLLLSILLNKLLPGCYPDANSLDTNYALRNLYRVFQLLEYHFNITPKCNVEEIITCSNGSDSKLLELLLQLKNETDTRIDEVKPASVIKEREEDNSHNPVTSTNCVARGTGLMVGFVGRAANFIVFFASMSDLDLVVEIKGPCGTICTERITKRSPKKKQVLKPWKPASQHNVVRSSSNEDRNLYNIKKDPRTEIEDDTRYMPLEYEVHSNRIYFAYMPLLKGDHQIKILSQGMHVSDSPYTVAVGPVVGAHKNIDICCLKPSLKVDNVFDHPEHTKASVRFQEPNERKERLGKIIKRRVLRYIVKIDNKDIVVDTDSINNLATSLLKMDYEFQKPSLSRRNSWGFVGDAERKVSVIRQFCVNMDELEAQSAKLHRSHSVSGSSKRTFSRSGSYECEDIQQQKKLETVTEGTVSHFESVLFRNSEAEEDLVYLNEDFENSVADSKNDEGCFVEVDTPIYTPKNAEDSIEDFIEVTPFVKDFDNNPNLSRRRNATTPINSLKDEAELFTEISNTVPLDLLPSASEISRRHVKHINEGATFTDDSENLSNFKLTESEINDKEKQRDVIRDIKLNYEEIGYIPLTEDISLAENSCENSNVPKTNHFYGKLVSKTKDIEDPNANTISDEVFIEEELCTKTDVREINQTLQNSKKFSGSCSSPKPNSEKPEQNNTNSFECLENNFPEEHYIGAKLENLYKIKPFKDTIENKGYRRWPNKKCLANTKMNKKKIKDYQRCSNQFANRPLFNFSSGFNQSNNNSSNIKEHNNKIRSKHSKTNAKIENFSLSTNQNNVQAKHSEKVSLALGLKGSPFPYSQKRFQRNPTTLFMNNLKAENKPDLLEIKMDDANENKIPSQFSAKVANIPPSLNNKYSLTNLLSVESDIQISLSQVSGISSDDNSQHNFSNKTTPTSIALCQLNFRHFNPTLPNKRTSLVRNRINQWEKSVYKEDVSSESKTNNQPVSKSIDIKSRLNFWETVTKENKLRKECHKMINGNSTNEQENTTHTAQLTSTDLEIKDDNRNRPHTSTPTTINKRKAAFRLNEESPVSRKDLDDKLSSSLTFSKTKRRASDPGVSEARFQDALYTVQEESKLNIDDQASDQDKTAQSNDPETSSRESMSQMAHQTSSAEYPSSSSLFDNSIDDDDDVEFSADPLDSTEDEYIDDEISESASVYWGDLSVMERLKIADTNEYRDLCRIVDGEFWRNGTDVIPPSPVECQVFGIATYFGYVAVKNKFQVLTKGSGCGNLSATLQGFGRHDVSQVNVRYTQKDVYEITYQVMSPGLYLISVRWMENPIVGSPFLCKVTF